MRSLSVFPAGRARQRREFPNSQFKLDFPAPTYPPKFPRLDGHRQSGSIDTNCPSPDPDLPPLLSLCRQWSRGPLNPTQCLPPPGSTYVFPAHDHSLPSRRSTSHAQRVAFRAMLRQLLEELNADGLAHRYYGTPPLPSAYSTASPTREHSTPHSTQPLKRGHSNTSST